MEKKVKKTEAMKRFLFISFSVIFSIGLLPGCRNILSDELAKLINDKDAPDLTIDFPEDRSEYSTIVIVSGTVRDDLDGDFPEGEYEVSGTQIKGAFQPEEDGTFLFSFATREDDGTALVAGTFTLDITVFDLGGNSSRVSLDLVPPEEGDFSGFSAVPGNKSAVLSWEAVSGAGSYTLYNLWTGEKAEGVSSPYSWEGLDNGELYTFQLEAVMVDNGGDSAWSSRKDAIPLNKRTLAPRIKETAYRSITIEWNEQPGIEKYILERKVDQRSWSSHALVLDTEYEDEDLALGSLYAYRVRPSGQEEIVSASCEASPSVFPKKSFVDTVALSSEPNDVLLYGNYAYVADGSSGLAVVDVTDPENAGSPRYISTGGEAEGMAVSGKYAFVADGDAGMAVFDLSNPASPKHLLSRDTTGHAYDIFISGDYAFVADGDSGLAVIGISDPEAPGTPVYRNTSGISRGVTVKGDYAYISDGASGMAVIDVSAPDSPGAPVYQNTTGGTLDIQIEGNYALLADATSGLAVIDISTPTSPGLPAYTSLGGSNYAMGIKVVDSIAYIATANNGLSYLDVSDPTNPGTVRHLSTNNDGNGLDVSGGYIYLADAEWGLAIAQIVIPIVKGSSPTFSGNSWEVALSGDYAYVAANSGLNIYNVFDPLNPFLISSLDLGSQVFGVAVSEDYVYLAAAGQGLAIIDISDPVNPGAPVFASTASDAYDVALYGDYACLASGVRGMAVIDISDPMNPGDPEFAATSDTAYGIAVSGHYAYLAVNSAGLAVIDISDPRDLGVAVYEDTSATTAFRVDVAGSYAYLADFSADIALVNVTDPKDPQAPDFMTTGGTVRGVTLSGSYCFAAGASGGLAAVYIADPSNPEDPDYLNISGPTGVAVRGEYAYGAGSGGFTVTRMAD